MSCEAQSIWYSRARVNPLNQRNRQRSPPNRHFETPHDVPAAFAGVVGQPADEIVDVAERHKAKLIVVHSTPPRPGGCREWSQLLRDAGRRQEAEVTARRAAQLSENADVKVAR
jgi:hypothetical protein